MLVVEVPHMTTPTRAPLALTPSLLDALTQRLQELMAEHHVPGVAIGLLTPEGQREICLGVTNVENPLPVTPDTLFQIGSTTKTVTATVLMRLVEEGRVNLDAPVRTYLPDLRLMDEDAAANVTVRQLLNHTGGWVGDYFENTGNGDDALTRIVANLIHQEQVTPLGEVWSYNNAAFYIAGRVIEVVTGETYEAAARRLVLEPAGNAAIVLLSGRRDDPFFRGGARRQGRPVDGGAALGVTTKREPRRRSRQQRA